MVLHTNFFFKDRSFPDLFSRKTNDFESALGAALETKGSSGFEGDAAQAS